MLALRGRTEIFRPLSTPSFFLFEEGGGGRTGLRVDLALGRVEIYRGGSGAWDNQAGCLILFLKFRFPPPYED